MESFSLSALFLWLVLQNGASEQEATTELCAVTEVSHISCSDRSRGCCISFALNLVEIRHDELFLDIGTLVVALHLYLLHRITTSHSSQCRLAHEYHHWRD